MIPAYGDGFDSLHVDRVFERGEKFEWEGYAFTVDWMPGQTEFGCCVSGRIDGKLIAFTGDNLFGNSSDPQQSGHEAVVARNSAIFEEGYIEGADFLRRLQPDLIVAGHSWVMDRPSQMIERFAAWAREIRDVYRDLSAEEDYRNMFDPYWVRAEPYRASVKAGQAVEATLHVRNFLPRTQSHSIRMCASPGHRRRAGDRGGDHRSSVRRIDSAAAERRGRSEAGRAHRRVRRHARRQTVRPMVRHGRIGRAGRKGIDGA